MIGSSIVSSPEDGLDKLAKHARGVLVLIACVQFIGGGMLYVAGAFPDLMGLMPTLVLGGIFVGLALWARSNPLTAVLVGLGLWAASVLAAAAVEPSSLFQGVIVKAIIVAGFVNGVSTGMTYNKMKATLSQSSSTK